LIFAKLDVSVYSHRRFVEAGFEAVGYWALILAYLRHQESGDGFLASALIGVPLGAGCERCLPLCEKLVSVGLFRKVEGGYLFVNYAEKNETKDEIAQRIEATRERKARSRRSALSRVPERGAVTRDRARPPRSASRVTADSDSDSGSGSSSLSGSGSRSGSGSGSGSGSPSPSDSGGGPSPSGSRPGSGSSSPLEPPEPPPEATAALGEWHGARRPLPPSERAMSGNYWLAAFTEGIAAQTGRPCTAGRMYVSTLERIVEHHAPERDAPSACAWLRDEAKAFAKKWDGKHPPKGLTPDGLERWLNEGRQGPPEFGKPRIVQLPAEEWHEDDWSDLHVTVLK
jgi:hypothetical protein